MLIERAEFADLEVLAAHRQHCWDQQLDHIDVFKVADVGFADFGGGHDFCSCKYG